MSIDEHEFDKVPPTPLELQKIEAACDERVAELKAQGVEPVERASLTADLRQRAGLARSALFGHTTQGRGKPAKYGTGKKEAAK